LLLPFWYWLTWVVAEKEPLNGCMYVHLKKSIKKSDRKLINLTRMMATASLRTISLKTNAQRSTSTLRSLKIAKTLTATNSQQFALILQPF